MNATDYDVSTIQAALREQKDKADRLEDELMRAREELAEVLIERDLLLQNGDQLQDTRDFYRQAS